MAERVPVLLLTGTVGSGKTTVAFEINDVLSEMEIPNAMVDLDALTAQWPPSSRWNADLMFENLALLWPNYRKHGATHLVLAHVFEDPNERERYCEAIPGAELRIVRLLADDDLRRQRLVGRMPPGPSLDWHLNRTAELETILQQAELEDFAVDNGSRPIREVAIEILNRAGWL